MSDTRVKSQRAEEVVRRRVLVADSVDDTRHDNSHERFDGKSTSGREVCTSEWIVVGSLAHCTAVFQALFISLCQNPRHWASYSFPFLIPS
jgi:hypothetical protein